MRNFFKNVDLCQIQDRVTDLKSQVDDIRFRKPWTNGGSASPLMLLAIGAGVAVAGLALYKKRSEVAKLCNNCGDTIKDKLSGMHLPEFIKEPVTHI